MRVPVSWLRDYVDLPTNLPVSELAHRLTMLGLKVEALESPGADVHGPLVVGRVLRSEAETHSNGKTIQWCSVDVGEPEPRGIVCGASNFAAGDLVAVALPGAVLPGGFAIAARRAYGHVSDGMICSAREIGVGDDAAGILVLPAGSAAPGDDAVSALHVRDEVIEFEINPDRAYALSIRGIAREAATAYGLAFDDPGRSLPAAKAGAGYPVRVSDPADCPVFVALEVTGFDPSAFSPTWLARRVELAGMRPISLAVDVTNYVMLELGTPIHGYDKAKLRGPLTVRRAESGEVLRTLDGVERALRPDDVLITDGSGPIGLAGVMGGATTGLTADTRDVVIEAAVFEPVLVARTARRLKLASEAARRFERGVDATIAAVAAQRVADLLVRYGGGAVAPTATQTGSVPTRDPIALAAGLPSRISGVTVTPRDVVVALQTVGCDASLRDETVTAVPPPWRGDLTDPYDLVEEVTRIVGYDKVPSLLPTAPAGRGLSRTQRLRRRVSRAVAQAGYLEVWSYPFVGPADWTRLGLPSDDRRREAVRVTNPLSEEEPMLRTTLLPGMLRALALNAGRANVDVALFETGNVFMPEPDGPGRPPQLGVDRRPTVEELKLLAATLPAQPEYLAAVLGGLRSPGSWWGSERHSCWADAIQLCRDVAAELSVPIELIPGQRAPWHPGRCALVVVSDTVVGAAGELHPKVCSAYGVPPRAAAAELDLSALLAQSADTVSAPALSPFPVGKEDVAVVVDASVPAADVAAALRRGAGELLESLRLFDVYAGEQVPPGRKSLAFALRFRAADHTLSEAEIKAAREAAVAAAHESVAAVLRT
jgi:phenylalanyl-tRNA synthetase beta chain